MSINEEQDQGFDIAEAQQVAEQEDLGTPVPVKDVTGNERTYRAADGTVKQVVIWMAGLHSRRYRRKREQQKNRKMKRNTLTEGKFHDDTLELAAACAIRWDGIRFNGQPVECNEHNALQLFKAASWVLDDCVEAMEDPALFFGSASPPQ